MRIIEPGFEVMFTEQLDGALKRLEQIARTCYKSEDRIHEGSDVKLIKTLLSRKHFPMFDHVSVSVRVVCDRGVTHEIVRHRIAAYAQESTRYCNYGKDKFGGHVTFIKPCFFPEIPLGTFTCIDNISPHILKITEEGNESPTVTNRGCLVTDWAEAMLFAEDKYLFMLTNGASPQEARSVLPNSLKTEIVMTLDLTAWRHFFELRTGKSAHPQMREIAVPMLAKFKRLIPLVFDDIMKEPERDELSDFVEGSDQ